MNYRLNIVYNILNAINTWKITNKNPKTPLPWITKITQLSGVSYAYVTRILNHLESKGVIDRKIVQFKKKLCIDLTEKGQRVYEALGVLIDGDWQKDWQERQKV